jgi:hypothetical protein
MEDELAFKDYKDKTIIHLGNDAPPIRIAGLAHGMATGAPSVAIGIEIGDDTLVLAETSLALFLNAADMLRAKYKTEGAC